MKHLTTLLLFSYFPILLFSQTDVTSTYMENPDFEMRYAAWHNEGATKGAVGGFTHQVNSSFGSKANTVYMEKWVSAGSKVSDCNIKQKLFLPEGTYQLTVAAMNTQNGTAASGAYLYAGASSAEVGDEADYSVTFSVADQPVVVGFKTVSCTGNWVCLDNFRLYKLDDDAEAIALQRTADEEEYATLKANIEAAEASGATKPTVVTNPYVATGSTIALGRSTITTNGATILERGFCYGTEPEPTVMDNRTTDYFTNNGYIYRMENLTPATIYYVRAYAMTSDYAVAYGDEVKVATKLKGSVSYWYNSGGSDEENYRIRSAIEETVWMYNNLSYITGFSISCTYGASTATADCSYGGSMRVGPVTSYQQTGTLLHETNHGVGVGTSSEWYSNANYRASTTYGKWLGPVANELLQFLQNDDAAFMTGDGTHMWGTTTSSITMKSYGINGANEDSYSPSDQLLYWGNIMLTHALHIDGLKCSSSVGWAVPTYVFEQRDTTKYYIKCEDSDYGTGTYLTHTNTGTLKSVAISNEEAQADDAYAWYITYNAKTGYYTFTNVGSGRVIGLSSSALKAVTSSAASIHLFPSKEKVTMGDYSKHSYWITASKGSYALKGGSSACSTTSFSYADGTEAQRWLFLSADEMDAYDAGQASTLLSELTELIDNVRAVSAVAHTTTEEGIDEALEETLSTIESEMDSYGTTQISAAISNVEAALQTFLANAKVEDESNLFDLTFLLTNPTVMSSTDGWTGAASCSSDVCEYYTTSAFDFNQTTALKLPKGTYVVRMQGFQRPGSYSTVYTDYVTNGTNNVCAYLYGKSTTALVKNIFDDATTTKLHSDCVAPATKCYIPNTMASAATYFTKGYYDNEVEVTTTTSATFKLGVKCAAVSSNYWTCFRNFRLLSKGTTADTSYNAIENLSDEAPQGPIYDLAGRQVTQPTKGIYIRNGQKVRY